MICKTKTFVNNHKANNNLKETDINNIIQTGNKFKDIDIKNGTCYFFDDMINKKNLEANQIKIDEKS